MAYERKFPTNKKETTKGSDTQVTEDTNAVVEERVDRSSRVSSNAVRPVTANRRNPDDLSVPQPIQEYFRKQGYSLRWVSVVDIATKTFSNKRINQFITIGGDLVTAKEIKEVDSSFLQGMVKYDYREEFADEEDEARGHQQGIRKGDLILMKLPMDYINARKQENADTVREQMASSTKEHLKRGLEVKSYRSKSGVQQVSGSFFND